MLYVAPQRHICVLLNQKRRNALLVGGLDNCENILYHSQHLLPTAGKRASRLPLALFHLRKQLKYILQIIFSEQTVAFHRWYEYTIILPDAQYARHLFFVFWCGKAHCLAINTVSAHRGLSA